MNLLNELNAAERDVQPEGVASPPKTHLPHGAHKAKGNDVRGDVRCRNWDPVKMRYQRMVEVVLAVWPARSVAARGPSGPSS